MSAKGTAAFRERLVLRHTTLAVRRGAVALEGEVTEFDPERAALDVPSFRLTGAGGTMQGSVLLRPGLVEGSASGSNLDLGALGFMSFVEPIRRVAETGASSSSASIDRRCVRCRRSDSSTPIGSA